MIEIDGNHLTIQQVVQIARDHAPVRLSAASKEEVKRSRRRLKEMIAGGDPVYGINTGFGIFADQKISTTDSRKLNRNLILSHAVSTGRPLPEEVVRAAMLIRANTLAKGYSGVRLELIQTILEMLNKNLTPEVPSQGSLGSSGDLSPLSHLALVFTKDDNDLDRESGFAHYQGQRMTGRKAMQQADIPRLELKAKEALALSNGATFSAALAALGAADAGQLIRIAEIALGMSLEALLGSSRAYDPRIHQARHHPGQISTAENVRRLISGSSLVDSTERLQDAYSLRCAPQVHGPIRETKEFVDQVIHREINAATDNPLIFPEGEVLSGGNFHGEPIGLVMDYLSIALTELAGISERRVFRLMDSSLNAGLPPMLVDSPRDAGLNSGLMMLQYTAASLVLENRSLASPDSTNSLPTSAEQEDHNANSMTAARHTRRIAANTGHVLAIELYSAARALDLRRRALPYTRLGKGTSAAYSLIRDKLPPRQGDAWWAPEIDQVLELITDQSLIREVNHALDS